MYLSSQKQYKKLRRVMRTPLSKLFANIELNLDKLPEINEPTEQEKSRDRFISDGLKRIKNDRGIKINTDVKGGFNHNDQIESKIKDFNRIKQSTPTHNEFDNKMKRKIYKNIAKNLTAVEINSLNSIEMNRMCVDLEDSVDGENQNTKDVNLESLAPNHNDSNIHSVDMNAKNIIADDGIDDLDIDKIKLNTDRFLVIHDKIIEQLEDSQILAINAVVKDIRTRLLGKQTKSRAKLICANP